MNIIIWTAAGICLLLSALICRYLKHWAWIILGLALSLPISFGGWILVIHTPQIARTGLGIIALAPVMLIMVTIIDLTAALIGGVIVIVWRKKLS